MTTNHKRKTKRHRRQARATLLAGQTAGTLTARGFEAPGANGLLTQVGTFNGQPIYQVAGSWYFAWMGTPPGWWAVQPDDPRIAGFNGIYYKEDSTLTGQYVIGGSSTPAGSVSG